MTTEPDAYVRSARDLALSSALSLDEALRALGVVARMEAAEAKLAAIAERCDAYERAHGETAVIWVGEIRDDLNGATP